MKFMRIFVSGVLVFAMGSAQASVVTINTTYDLTTGFFNTPPLSNGPVSIVNGDKVMLNVDFQGNQALTIGDGSEYFGQWLAAGDNNSSFTINNAVVNLTGFSGSGGAVSNYLLGTQSGMYAHLGPTLNDFLAPGQSVTFGGYQANYDVQSIAVSPHNYSDLFFYAGGDNLSITTSPPPKLFGLFVGIDDNELLGLEGIKNATAVRDSFLGAFNNADIDNLVLKGLNKSTGYSSAQLEADLDSVMTKVGPDDLFVLYTSSHGGTSPQDGGEMTVSSGDEALVFGSDQSLFNLHDDELANILNKYGDKNKWVILDACHSGGFLGDINMPETNGFDMANVANTSFLASATESGVGTFNSYSGRSSFSKAIEDAFGRGSGNLYVNADANNDGTISLLEVGNYVQNWENTDYFTAGDTVVYGFTDINFPGNDPYVSWTKDEWIKHWNPVFTTNSTQNLSFNTAHVAPVPEPETYAMLLAGLGLFGFTARRRKDHTV